MKKYITPLLMITFLFSACKKEKSPTIQKAKVAFEHMFGFEEGEYWMVSTGVFDSQNRMLERKHSYHPQNLPSIVTKDTVLHIQFYETGDTAIFGCCYPTLLPNISVVKID